jgi:DNA repair photolyase
MIVEKRVATALDVERPPGSEPLTVLDAYDGCLSNCPYCFQRRDPSWNADVIVKTNIVDALGTELAGWLKDALICVGSRSDPYMPLERKYRLTRQCLQLLNEHEVPVVITTKADTQMILADLDLFTNWHNDLKILVGFSNLRHYQHLERIADLQPLETLRRLTEHGVTVEAFITPVLPGITDVEQILPFIDPGIPVYLDKLRISDQNGALVLEYIRRHYPALVSTYERLLHDGEDDYYAALCRSPEVVDRCTFTFFDSQV